MIGLKKTEIVKKRILNHLVVTTPQDRSLRCRILRYSERLFPSMRTVVFLGFFTSGRGSSRRSPKSLFSLRRSTPNSSKQKERLSWQGIKTMSFPAGNLI